MPELPRGTVTFLFTDVEGSTRLWEQHPQAMRLALARHDALIEELVAEHGGVLVRPRGEGDSRFAVFSRASDAVAAAAAIQQALWAEPWPAETMLRVRLALHTGEADLRDGDYYGSAVNRCARLRAIAHGGQTLLSQATHDLVCDAPPAAVRLRELGEHRLADLQRPERVYQLLAPGAPADFAPLRSLANVPNNLPLQLTSFVGRETAMAEVRRLLERTRLLTLIGAGGVGKTRVALQVAAQQLEHHPDGVWLVELAPQADPALVPQAVATALGLQGEPGRPLIPLLSEVLRSRALLLVLDNCEHLIASCADLADTLLRSCPRLRLLATSREALAVAGEQIYRVPSLTTPPATRRHTLEELAAHEAVQLFVDRARARRPDFVLGAGNAPAVAALCARLDGIPLAIELAAARVESLAVEGIAARLDDRFRLLTGGPRTALPRQRTLRAALDWSYDLLKASEQLLLDRLSVFAGGWTLDAAEAVCAGEGLEQCEILDLLGSLVSKSLVQANEAGEELRYGLLETVRQYGREKLAGRGEAEALPDRHAAYYLDFVRKAAAGMWGPEQLRWLTRLEEDHDNVRVILARCFAPSALEGQRATGASASPAPAAGSRAWVARGVQLAVPMGWF